MCCLTCSRDAAPCCDSHRKCGSPMSLGLSNSSYSPAPPHTPTPCHLSQQSFLGVPQYSAWDYLSFHGMHKSMLQRFTTQHNAHTMLNPHIPAGLNML